MRRSLARNLSYCLCSILALGSIGCHRSQPWNVLLVTFDTTRADRLGCYGNTHIQTPNIDRLADDGVRFANAMATVPITTPSHSTIMTGLYPIAHGVRDNGLFVLADEQLTLAEILREEGYATGAAVGAFPLTAQFGLDQGFDFFDDHLTGGFENYLGNRAAPKDRLFFDERRAAQVNEALLPWLRNNADGPFFAWIHYFDPHQPFEPGPPFDQLYADDLYNGEIAYADARLGFLLDQLESLGVLDHTLVIMTGDHGEGLGEHNETTHAVLAYNSTLHVPLIVRPPKGVAPAGAVIEQIVSTVDIAPTVLDLLGIGRPEGLQGVSLAPQVLDDRAPLPSRLLYAENLSPRLTHGWAELRVLFDGPFKYIHGPHAELFDLVNDPGETQNLLADRSADGVRMSQALQGFINQHAVVGSSTTETLDDDVRQRLEALGYLHGPGSFTDEISETLQDDGIAPQDRVGDINALSGAKHLLFQGRAADALIYTQKLTAANPDSPLYLELHASALAETGRLDDAWDVIRHMNELGAVPEPLMLRVLALRFETGDETSSLDFLTDYVATTPSSQGQWLLASLYDRQGESAKVRRALEKALSIEPNFVPARIDLAVLYAKAGDTVAAEQEFFQAVNDAPYYAKTYYNFGTFELQNRRFSIATGYFERAIALAPNYAKARLGLVVALIADGQLAAAEQAFEELSRIAPRSEETVSAAALLKSR